MDARNAKPVNKPVMYDPMIIPRVKQVRGSENAGNTRKLFGANRIGNGAMEMH